jgi:hypothetical protein
MNPPITKLWKFTLVIMERNLLRYYGVPEDKVLTADGSFMECAFLKGWQSCMRRK